MFRHTSRNGFFFFKFLKVGNIFENLDRKGTKRDFMKKKTNKQTNKQTFLAFLALFCQNFQKYCLIQTYEKLVPREVS